jgi:hypothetical protein
MQSYPLVIADFNLPSKLLRKLKFTAAILHLVSEILKKLFSDQDHHIRNQYFPISSSVFP